jgi:hypothetical protein
MARLGYASRHVSGNEDKGPVAEEREAADTETRDIAGSGDLHVVRTSSVVRTGGCGVADETERTRLIADITRLMREPAMPESTRVAGMTLIGWLARRRVDEAPHSIGIDEARESERRIRAARAKAR